MRPNRMKEIRARERITQFGLAVKTSITQGRLSYYENGLIIPRDDEKQRIANALNVKIDEIFPEEK